MYAKDQDSVGKWNNYLSNKNCLTIRAEYLAKQILTFHSTQTHRHARMHIHTHTHAHTNTHKQRQTNQLRHRKRQRKLYV